MVEGRVILVGAEGPAEGGAEGFTVGGGTVPTILVVRSCRDSMEVVFLIETSEFSTFTSLNRPKSGNGKSTSSREVDGVGLGSFGGAVGDGVWGMTLCVVIDGSYTVPASQGCFRLIGWVGGTTSSSDSEEDDSSSELDSRLFFECFDECFFFLFPEVSRCGGAAWVGGTVLTASRICVDIDVIEATVSRFICLTWV